MLVLDAEPEIGGRMRSHRADEGFLIDRGFQILLSADPALWRSVAFALARSTPAPGAGAGRDG